MDRPTQAWPLLQAAPRLGWVAEPTPVTALPELAKQLQISWLGVKRDDLAQPLHGGSKLRKLDYLLAAEPWRSAPQWSSAGAIGSGHLVALAAAAEQLHKRLHGELFWEPLSHGVLENLAYTVSTAQSLRFHRHRLGLALTAAPVLLGGRWRGAQVVPPGATAPIAALGLVRAGLELGQQVAQGELPCPERIYAALGSGGTAAGLLVGLHLAGLPTQLHAVLTVERLLAPRPRLVALVRSIEKILRSMGLEAPPVDLRRLILDPRQIGPGYGVATAASQTARDQLLGQGIAAEDVYTGKAWAALIADANQGGPTCKGPWLFWNTVRSSVPLPADPLWLERLPEWLRLRLEAGQSNELRPLSRRAVLQTIGGVLAISVAAARTYRKGGIDQFRGRALSAGQAEVVALAAAVILAPAPPPAPLEPGLSAWLPVAQAVDNYVAGLPRPLRVQIYAMLSAFGELAPAWDGLAGLEEPQRLSFLRAWQHLPPPLADAWSGIRDLVMLGYYQLPQSWSALGYSGPMVPDQPRPRRPSYDRLVAPPGLAMHLPLECGGTL